MEFLSQKGVEFTAKNVVEDSKAKDELRQRTGRMTCPAIIVDGDVVIGFDQGRLESLLGLR
ncbi:MAG: glutaredoxin family protein [Candidatus Methylomirabilales bacterium]